MRSHVTAAEQLEPEQNILPRISRNLVNLRRMIVTGSALAALLGTSAVPAQAMSLKQAVEWSGHSYGSTVDKADVRAALERIGHGYGSTVDKGDRKALRDWGRWVEKAVRTALDQVGDDYEYGGSGPHQYDCSGLTRYAWAAAGVDLPHSSRRQHDITRSVSRSDIRPGDLLFFRRPVGHAAIYIGDGKVVEASREGVPVRVNDDAINRGDLVKIGRVYSDK